ncbi:hypothetical protein [Deinococcus marmoris]|uniref:Uncharacterized protein n=1 Tax=Deinococcus marmoris TaxID=249408 RepID=A0A1U7P2Y3_9DEIO|nr:hypothetical protein [Deinococcus marmoris]OLV19519.1 hypothetical protein BOO71_0002296 [Deinococcus marmoris]
MLRAYEEGGAELAARMARLQTVGGYSMAAAYGLLAAARAHQGGVVDPAYWGVLSGGLGQAARHCGPVWVGVFERPDADGINEDWVVPEEMGAQAHVALDLMQLAGDLRYGPGLRPTCVDEPGTLALYVRRGVVLSGLARQLVRETFRLSTMSR